jgi:hypothetical protein
MTRLDKLPKDNWGVGRDIVMFGCGRQGKKMYSTLNKDFNIVAVVDNDSSKWGMDFEGHTIMSACDAEEYLKLQKVVITVSEHYYQTIKRQLEDIGLHEYIDFVMYQQFVTEWYYKFKNQINVLKTDISLTTRCTLNCENCMQFLPYWEKGTKQEYSLDEKKADLDTLFSVVDYVFDIDFVGGEPFLYSNIDGFVTYIGDSYRERIGYMGFITNGTIVPNDSTCMLLKKYGIGVSISDYSNFIEYNHKIPEIVLKLEKYGINYTLNKNIDWYDFGFPNDRYSYDDKQVAVHMKKCNTVCHLLDNKKLYYCGCQWAAQKGGLFNEDDNAYIDLEKVECGKIEKRQILELMLGNVSGGYLDFCKVCGGFGIDNNNKVETARQIKLKER